jgi:hypothetical protein
VSLHLAALIDDRGIWQHATGVVPAPEHGYCLDDAARAAIVASRLARADPRWRPALSTCCRFMDDAIVEGRGARNFMDANGRWLDGPHHGDHVGRAIWALGALTRDADVGIADWARQRLPRLMAEQQAHGAADLPPRLYALLGVAECDEPDRVSPIAAVELAALNSRGRAASRSWPWPEPRVRYDAGRLPQALVSAGRTLDRPEAVAAGLRLLDWLTQVVDAGPWLRFPGHLGVGPGESIDVSGDEQPLEVAAFAAAHAAATGSRGRRHVHESYAVRALAWFRGDNRLGLPLAEPDTGGCHDGLGREARNDNQGAESTIAYVETVLTVRDLLGDEPTADGPLTDAGARRDRA